MNKYKKKHFNCKNNEGKFLYRLMIIDMLVEKLTEIRVKIYYKR